MIVVISSSEVSYSNQNILSVVSSLLVRRLHDRDAGAMAAADVSPRPEHVPGDQVHVAVPPNHQGHSARQDLATLAPATHHVLVNLGKLAQLGGRHYEGTKT